MSSMTYKDKGFALFIVLLYFIITYRFLLYTSTFFL